MAGIGRKPRTAGGGRDQLLQKQLVRLWSRLTGEREPPPLDRWLARELAALRGLPRDDRLLLGELVADAVRFAPLTLFCEERRKAGGELPAALAGWAGTEGPVLWRRLRRLAPPVVFFWTFMRKREAGAKLPPIAPPGPDALAVWRLVTTWAPAAGATDARALWAGLPPAMLPLVAARGGLSGWSAADPTTFLDRHAARPPVWLRLADPRRRAAVTEELARDGFTLAAEDGPALAVTGPRGIYELAAHREGLVEVQDLASQRIGAAVDARPGQTVWDCCAGAGGKTLQLAAALGGRGAVHATDLHEGRLKDLRRRVRRGGWDNVRTAGWDGERLPDFGPEVSGRGGFDRVLVDAPCSGSGTWRRNPDGRLRFAAAQLADLAAVQAGLLGLAADAVRPGGLLVYATCSFCRAENQDVTAAFLEARPQFVLRAQRTHGNPAADADTTFTAVLERRSG